MNGPRGAEQGPRITTTLGSCSGHDMREILREHRDRYDAAIDLFARCGATRVQVMHEHDGVAVDRAGWYVVVELRGHEVTSPRGTHPVDVLEDLAVSLVNGGRCMKCRRDVETVSIDRLVDVGQGRRCQWYRDGKRWLRSCGR